MFKVLTTLHRAHGAIYDEDNVLSQIKTIRTGGTLVTATLTQIINRLDGQERVDIRVAVVFPSFFDGLDFDTKLGQVRQYLWNNTGEFTLRTIANVFVSSIMQIQLPLPESGDKIIVGNYEFKPIDETFDVNDLYKNFPAPVQLNDLYAGGTLVTAVYTWVGPTYSDNIHITILIPQKIRLDKDPNTNHLIVMDYLRENFQEFTGIQTAADLVEVNMIIRIKSGIITDDPHILNTYTNRKINAP